MKIINLTPHPIDIGDRHFPMSGTVARVPSVQTPAGEIDGIPILTAQRWPSTGLPAPIAGTLYIVLASVRLACPDRKDLASPARLIRNASGAIIGCQALEVNP